jgi:hypothetical protein
MADGVCLASYERSVRVTVPALLGASKVVEIVERLLKVAGYNVSRSRNPLAAEAQALADEWPEFVLGPENPLTFLSPDMKCTFFNA